VLQRHSPDHEDVQDKEGWRFEHSLSQYFDDRDHFGHALFRLYQESHFYYQQRIIPVHDGNADGHVDEI
jgi:hypothetical protein